MKRSECAATAGDHGGLRRPMRGKMTETTLRARCGVYGFLEIISPLREDQPGEFSAYCRRVAGFSPCAVPFATFCPFTASLCGA